MASEIDGVQPQATPPAPVAPASPPSPPVQPDPERDAAALAIKHGGNKGGRPRKDGLVPGSPEALLADRQKDAARKRADRDRARSLLAQLQNTTNQAQPAPGQGQPLPPAHGTAVNPWRPDLVAPVFEQVVPALEKYLQARLAARAAKANLPADLVREIEKDAAFPAPAKAALVSAGPLCVSKWLNELGVGAENAPEVILATAVGSIGATYLILASKLETLIRENEKRDGPKKPA